MSKQIEVQVNGNRYPCRMTMGAMLRFKQETGKEVTEIDSGSLSDLCTLLWCCVKSATKADGIDFALSLMDFADSVTQEEVKAWMDASKDRGAVPTDNSETPEKKT